MEKSAVEWYSDKLLEILGETVNNFTTEQTMVNHYALKQAKEIESQQKDEFVIEFSEWKDINCIYYDGWNIRVPLGDKYSDVYTNKELLEIYKKVKAL
jgi:hypothetical protein